MNFNGFNIEHLQKRINKNAVSEGSMRKRLYLLKVPLDFEGEKEKKWLRLESGSMLPEFSCFKNYDAPLFPFHFRASQPCERIDPIQRINSGLRNKNIGLKLLC